MTKGSTKIRKSAATKRSGQQGGVSDLSNNWYLTIRMADGETSYSICCMSKEQALETLLNEIDRIGGGVLEAELRHPTGHSEKLPMD